MPQLDVMSSFAICGAGALVSAAMLRPSLGQDDSEALRICRGAYTVLGVGLVQPVLLDSPLPLWSQAGMAFSAIAGVVLIGWALAALAGDRRSPAAMWLTLAAALAAVLAALPAGTRGITLVCTLGLALASTLIAWLGRRLLLHPRDLHERLIGVTVGLMLLSSVLRASYLFTWSGTYETHLVYAPSMMLTPFALLYGVLPVVFAMLLHNVINARLQLRLHRRATTDQLTGALSRHALADGVSALTAGPGRSRLAVVMADVDNFKLINDRHGHAGGDSVLCHAARLLQSQLRPDTLLARYGGEEFVAVVPVSDLPAARRVAERMRLSFEQAVWPELLPGLDRVTVSLGVALMTRDESFENALARADEALYRAKHGGRNQVQVALNSATAA
jgi:diguanylate cyclase (GGDEF)-like protein